MEEEVYENLVRFYNGIENGNYDIYASIEDFPKIVRLGYSDKDRLAIFKMLYLNNCTLEDLEEMSLNDLMDYIKETDDYFDDDKKYFDDCIKAINDCWNKKL